MTGPARVIDALYVDCGEGREIRHGDRAGQITWRRQPRARFECLRCHTVEGPVTGPLAVQRFAATIRTTHRATCPAAATHHGRTAA
ncbi:hypothetical protein [Streptomyces sp. DH12]|uniref:hypothetical protein n=1 Tax=Streptomyces sp. DH12 TaxID=2857010 RepID=UPI001E2B2B5A|nr:hypothetical protein [Streptomyces sp. DH12]